MQFGFQMNGFDRLQSQLEQARKALEALDGELMTASFDPADPASVESEILRLYSVIDSRMAPYSGNQFVSGLAGKLKAEFSKRIRDRAAQHRGQSP